MNVELRERIESKITPRLLMPTTGGAIKRVGPNGRVRFQGDHGKFHVGHV